MAATPMEALNEVIERLGDLPERLARATQASKEKETGPFPNFKDATGDFEEHQEGKFVNKNAKTPDQFGAATKLGGAIGGLGGPFAAIGRIAAMANQIRKIIDAFKEAQEAFSPSLAKVPGMDAGQHAPRTSWPNYKKPTVPPQEATRPTKAIPPAPQSQQAVPILRKRKVVLRKATWNKPQPPAPLPAPRQPSLGWNGQPQSPSPMPSGAARNLYRQPVFADFTRDKKRYPDAPSFRDVQRSLEPHPAPLPPGSPGTARRSSKLDLSMPTARRSAKIDLPTMTSVVATSKGKSEANTELQEAIEELTEAVKAMKDKKTDSGGEGKANTVKDVFEDIDKASQGSGEHLVKIAQSLASAGGEDNGMMAFARLLPTLIEFGGAVAAGS
jgi:hypothetical protein